MTKTEITKEQYYQLLGLVTASHHLEQQDNQLYNAFTDIVGDSISEGWFWEIRSEEQFERKLKQVLKQEGVKILQ